MSSFHFLRPEYLLLLLPAMALIWWLLQQQNDESKWKKVIDAKLLKHLLVNPQNNHARVPAPWHLALVLCLMIVALSGPSWKLKESPFIEDDTKIALLVSVKESMLTTDIMPNRLSRVSMKIEDLMKERSDTQAALLAYSGTAHLVLPLTKDHDIIKTFAQALDPTIMPLAGDNLNDALLLAQEQFDKKQVDQKGATLIVLTDSISPSQANLAMKNGFGKEMNVILWKIASSELSSASDFQSTADILNAEVVAYAGDNSDVAKVSSLIDKNFKNAAAGDEGKYEDGGYWLLPIIFLLLLLWARQGFVAELWRRS
ncbi:MAG: VWA domain-containing protein [Sulfurovum sp.]|nr:VWA domain-containing protein [Sulfurovum sp.]